MKPKKHNIDREWFFFQMKTRDVSLRALAKRLGISHSALSLALQGKRSLRVVEATAIADALGLSPHETIRRAGLGVVPLERQVRVAGQVGPGCKLEIFTDKPATFLPAPNDVPEDSVALIVREPGGSMMHTDGWVLFSRPFGQPCLDCLGRLCVVKPRGGDPILAHVNRGLLREHFSLVTPGREYSIDNADIEWAAPVLWIRP